MDNLVFCLNATVPIFIMMILGMIFKKIKWIDESFASKMNSFVFKVALPVMIFNDLATTDISESWDGGFVLFCFVATFLSIAIAYLVSLIFKREIRGEFVQGCYRSSAAILGIAFIQNIYGTSGMAPMMMIGSVPLYNVMAVILLSVFKPGQSGLDAATIRKTLIGIAKNPIIIGIAAGLLWSLTGITLPQIISKSTSMLGRVATPMGLLAMGASFDIHKAFNQLKPAITASFLKLVGFVAIFMPIAIHIGFGAQQLVALLVMLGSSTTVASFVMSKSMGHEGTVSSSVVMLTTLFCGFTLTIWLYILRSMGFV